MFQNSCVFGIQMFTVIAFHDWHDGEGGYVCTKMFLGWEGKDLLKSKDIKNILGL